MVSLQPFGSIDPLRCGFEKIVLLQPLQCLVCNRQCLYISCTSISQMQIFRATWIDLGYTVQGVRLHCMERSCYIFCILCSYNTRLFLSVPVYKTVKRLQISSCTHTHTVWMYQREQEVRVMWRGARGQAKERRSYTRRGIEEGCGKNKCRWRVSERGGGWGVGAFGSQGKHERDVGKTIEWRSRR